VVTFGLDLLLHLLLTPHHQLSHLLHVEVRDLGLVTICLYLLHLVREEDRELGTVVLFIAVGTVLVVVFVDFLYEFALD
jgi:hypothetical protein